MVSRDYRSFNGISDFRRDNNIIQTFTKLSIRTCILIFYLNISTSQAKDTGYKSDASNPLDDERRKDLKDAPIVSPIPTALLRRKQCGPKISILHCLLVFIKTTDVIGFKPRVNNRQPRHFTILNNLLSDLPTIIILLLSNGYRFFFLFKHSLVV